MKGSIGGGEVGATELVRMCVLDFGADARGFKLDKLGVWPCITKP